MARPRKIKYGNGEILLHNYSPEESDAIQAKLLESAKELTTLPQVGELVNLEKAEEVEVVDTSTMTHVALDLYLDPKDKEYYLMHVKYNPISKAGKVVEKIKAGSFRLAGVNNLKMELVKLGKI